MDQKQIEELKAVYELYKAGILTKEEVEREKNKILSKVPQSVENDSKPKYKNKKILIYSGLTILVLIGIGVFVGLYQHRQYKIRLEYEREQARQDSIAEVERLIEINRQDSIRKVTEIRNFTSPDLALFGLHGKVKSLKITQGLKYYPYPFTAKNIEFSEDGKLKSTYCIKEYMSKYVINSQVDKIKINKNSEGYIINVKDQYYGDDGTMNLYWQEGKLMAYDWQFYEFANKVTYSYKDNCLSEYNSEDSSLENGNKVSISYNNYEYDKFGNWIKCKYALTGIQEEYEPGLDEYDDSLVSVKPIKPETGFLVLEIEYYE